MIDPFVFFIVLAVGWTLLRVALRRWAMPRLATGELSMPNWFVLQAGSFAVIPLLALPFASFPNSTPLLILLSAAMFLAYLGMLWVAQRFIERG